MRQELTLLRDQKQRTGNFTPSRPDAVFDLRSKAVKLCDPHHVVSGNDLRGRCRTEAKQKNSKESTHNRILTSGSNFPLFALQATPYLLSIVEA